ncbi:MAG: hypothetical protein PUE73_04285 [Eubacteriales bacterium]|nr:hypothetical protein [Eubacteriales bacterium]
MLKTIASVVRRRLKEVGGITLAKEQRNELLESISNGKFKPSSVRRGEIPKENGALRKLMAM